jgi:hypothetical protein
MPRPRSTFELVTSLAAWMAIVFVLAFVVLVMVLNLKQSKADVCRYKIDNSVERLAGYKWQHRAVDGKQCWYYSNRILPKEDLVWSFNEQEFNSDIDRILERKFYKPVQDERILIEVD